MGKTFTEYRNEVRIHSSLKLLRESDDKIIAVAENVGISDLSYYNKLFKKHTGLTPREYRVKYRRDDGES
jgi:YesN/AraC family two-component response regulator